MASESEREKRAYGNSEDEQLADEGVDGEMREADVDGDGLIHYVMSSEGEKLTDKDVEGMIREPVPDPVVENRHR